MNQADTCQICKKNFTKQDQVVVCPHCGAPYHKECYDKEGHCAYEAKHATGFEYQSGAQKDAERKEQQQTAASGVNGVSQTEKGENTTQSNGGTLCQSCNTINARSNIFCENCGRPLHQNATMPNQSAASPFGGMPPFMQGGFSAQMPGMDLQGEFDGLSKQHWKSYIGQSVPAYFIRMSQQDMKKTKLSFSLSAFFFSYIYFAYRKMWMWAAIALLVELVLLVPGFLIIYLDAGVPFMQGISVQWLGQLQNIFYILGLVRNVAFGAFALYLFRKDAVKKIKKVQQNAPPNEAIQLLLAKKGGVSILGVLVVIAILFLYSTLWMLGGGDVLMDYMMNMMSL